MLSPTVTSKYCERMSPDTIIAARPHFRREGDQLYFFLSQRPFHSLNPAEVLVWEKLQEGSAAFQDFADSEPVESLVRSGLAEAIAPISQPNRRPILVIEPHCDDAALSIGGTMWKMRGEVEFHLLTMASRSNYTSAFHLHRNYFDRARITAMRTSEGELFAKHLGGHYHCADMAEATLRYDDSDWDLDFFKAHEVATAISNNRRAPRPVLDTWIERLREFLKDRSFDEIWVPLGAGTHSDHDLARNAALEVIVEDHPKAVIRLYEDVPYGAEFREHTDRILRELREAGATLTPWSQDVTAEFPAKLSLLSIFASQFKVPSIRPGVERSAGAGVSTVERLWTLETPPHRVPQDEMWIGAPGVAKASADLRKFGRGSTTAERVAVFAISAAGRWADDLDLLRTIFPAAKFVIYAGPRVCAEYRAVEDARVDVRCLDGRSSSWVTPALREAITSHRIVIAGDALDKAKALTMLWPIGRKIVVSQMGDLIQALPAN